MTNSGTYTKAGEFEELYIRLRQKEGRIYLDEEVATLPFIQATHAHYKEWVIRKHSCKALVSYIKHRGTIENILDVGCGNGWMAARLAMAADAEVTGLDINGKELEQARRVFKKTMGLQFLYGNLETETLADKKFDMIIFAASIQYFSSLKKIINAALEHLTLFGEIHILDSPFYRQQEIEAARQRTRDYYSAAGFAQMAAHYHHHSLEELGEFQYKILHHPHSWKNKLSIKQNPFYWICIKNRYS